MKSAGRPRLLDDTKKREVCALVSAGCSLDFAARYVSCTAKTIRREEEHDEAFGLRLRNAQLSARLAPLEALRGKAKTHWRAAAWLLERIDPEQFAKVDQKYYRPEEVIDLLENIGTALEDQLHDLTSKFTAADILQEALKSARLPKRHRNPLPKLGKLPLNFSDPVAAFLNEAKR